MDVVFAHADRIIVLARGELIAEGTPAEVRDDAKVQAGVLRRRHDIRGGGGERRRRRPDDLPEQAAPSRMPTRARRWTCQRRKGGPGVGVGMSAMLQVTGLDAWYGQARILFGVSLGVGAGECVALVGRNGAGKSTTMKAVMGLLGQEARQGGLPRPPTSLTAAGAGASAGSAWAGCPKTGASSLT